jgi:ribosome-associated protein
MEAIKIKEDFIKLDSALKLASAVSTGGHAKFVIQNGEVLVNGEICTARGKKLYTGDVFSFENVDYKVEK